MSTPLPLMRSFEGAVIDNRYRLEYYLDEGNFGAVYRATHLVYGVSLRDVAIKIAKRPMTDSEARSAFADALLMAKMVDASLDPVVRGYFIAVHDAGRCPEGGPLAGHPYVVMELVPGGSLKHSLRIGPFPLKRAIAYFDQILSAVAFMHRGGVSEGSTDAPRGAILHRDLKPSNILVIRQKGAPDSIKITDFGLAIETDSLLGWVKSGGDLAYLAPESFSHNIASPQTDVYMLALMFYEMLNGSNPFAEVGSYLHGPSGEKQTELRRLHLEARHAERFALLDRHEELRNRPAMARVIRTALAVEMTSRTYANADEFLAAWREAKRVDPQLSGEERSEQPWEMARRLTGEAEQCFAVRDERRGEELLSAASEINQDARRVPDSRLVGRTYLRMVEYLLRHGNPGEAGKLANEGYQRRKCQSTCLAMAAYYAFEKSPLAARFEQEAQTCQDQE
jgi:serine/threonine protein kinase